GGPSRRDLTSWLLAHPEGLSPEEVLHHLAVIVVAGNGPARTGRPPPSGCCSPTSLPRHVTAAG
ncbi:hypothetical protein, partial [Streptomyces thioluteus]|uniref:hypothetical protein n=1 Tax=Streptomyces thioluteus TaxID=66431 RepID=UPI0031EBA899